MIGNAELALLRRNIDDDVRSDFQRIVDASQQAADLAQQMLTYAGRGTIVRRDLDLRALFPSSCRADRWAQRVRRFASPSNRAFPWRARTPCRSCRSCAICW